MISTLPLTSGLANLATVPSTFVSSLLGISPSAITPAMEEEIKRQILSDAKRTGKYSGGIQYEDLGFNSVWDDEGEHPTSHYSKAGLFSPQTALGLTAGKMDWAVDPTTGEISFPGGTEYNFPDSFGKGLSDFINKQNTKYDPSNSIFNLGKPLKIDPAVFKSQINLFNPDDNKMAAMNPIEVYPYTSDYYRAKFQNIPYKDMSKQNNTNVFNQGTMEVEDYTTKKNRVLAEREAERQRLAKIAEQQRLAKIAEQQRLAKVAEQQKIDFQQRINPVANVPQSEYQTKMDDVYKNVVVDNSGNRGYTGTGTQSRAGIRNTPAYRGQQAAAAVDRKAKSMGVASPVRRTPGTKYGFGL